MKRIILALTVAAVMAATMAASALPAMASPGPSGPGGSQYGYCDYWYKEYYKWYDPNPEPGGPQGWWWHQWERQCDSPNGSYTDYGDWDWDGPFW